MSRKGKNDSWLSLQAFTVSPQQTGYICTRRKKKIRGNKRKEEESKEAKKGKNDSPLSLQAHSQSHLSKPVPKQQLTNSSQTGPSFYEVNLTDAYVGAFD